MQENRAQQLSPEEQEFQNEIKAFHDFLSEYKQNISNELMEKATIFANKIRWAFENDSDTEHYRFYIGKIREAHSILVRRDDQDYIKGELVRLNNETKELLNSELYFGKNGSILVKVLSSLLVLASVALIFISAPIFTTYPALKIASIVGGAIFGLVGFGFFHKQQMRQQGMIDQNNMENATLIFR